MRKAINDNRMVQLALMGVLALAGGLFLLKGAGGGSEPAPDVSSSETSTAATATGATGATTATAAIPTSSATPSVSVPANMVPGPGLPKGLLRASRAGKAVVLLVRRAGGIDDALVRSSVEALRSDSRVKLYVTKARGIARYAWLTQGVNVTDLPALIVLLPSKRTDAPTASVSYGFRKGASVAQAVDDALYRGPTNRSYHP